VPIATYKNDMERFDKLKKLFEASSLNDEDKALYVSFAKSFIYRLSLETRGVKIVTKTK